MIYGENSCVEYVPLHQNRNKQLKDVLLMINFILLVYYIDLELYKNWYIVSIDSAYKETNMSHNIVHSNKT